MREQVEKLVRQLEEYIPWNEQERADQQVILHMLQTQEDIFERSNLLAHMTASAWVVNQDHTKVLMVYHNIFNSWSWLGGHADGETDLLAVAIREVQEESGVKTVKPLSQKIFSLEVLTVDGHEKKGSYVPSHLHLNITYLLEACSQDNTRVKADENSAVDWFGWEEAIQKSTEPWFQERIYPKLNQKADEFLQDPQYKE